MKQISNNCPICNKISSDHSLAQLNECYRKFIDKLTEDNAC